jgi:hypothetical protein
MLPLLKYLILIRFRKLFAKDDYVAIALFLLGIVFLLYFFNKNYNPFINYSLLCAFGILSIHAERKDIELLKLSPKFHLILFLEYTLYSSPILFLLLINQKFISCLVLVLLMGIIGRIPKIDFKVMRYPFRMFDPYWIIAFRKYKLLLLLPLLVFVSFMAYQHNNDNLYYAVLLFVAVIACIPSFEREHSIHIKASAFLGKKYLMQQFKNVSYNSLFLLIPLAVLFIGFQQWELLLVIPLVLFFPMLNLLFKYAFFERKMIHNVFLTLFLGNIMYGFPLLFLPILYINAIKNLNQIQNA